LRLETTNPDANFTALTAILKTHFCVAWNFKKKIGQKHETNDDFELSIPHHFSFRQHVHP